VAGIHLLGERVPRDMFRKGGAITMALMGAGLACYSAHEMQELQWTGPYEKEGSDTTWFNEEMWDMSDCCNDKEHEFFKFLRTTLGYQDKPSPFELIVYLIRIGMTSHAAYKFLMWEKEQLALENIEVSSTEQELKIFSFTREAYKGHEKSERDELLLSMKWGDGFITKFHAFEKEQLVREAHPQVEDLESGQALCIQASIDSDDDSSAAFRALSGHSNEHSLNIEGQVSGLTL
tara:strand:- start:442 stop:1143 length:702 start_codon:yes stop_codon:yes gene_type:complete